VVIVFPLVDWSSKLITVTLYSRPGCDLCDKVKEELQNLQAHIPHRLIELNIEDDPTLLKKYLTEIPVVEIGPYSLKAPFTPADLAMTLGAANDTDKQKSSLGIPESAIVTQSDRFSLWMANHWLPAVSFLFILYLGLPFLAPVLMKTGVDVPARVIYTVYSPLCHQLGFRSFFLFGSQLYYPRAAAGISGVETFGQATGIDENDLLASRSFVGTEKLGYKVALCERDVAIYGAIIVFCLLYGLSRKKIPPLHWAFWILFAIGPISLDGFSQLFSQMPIPGIAFLFPYRESTPVLRVITGFLFGFGTAWFGLPYIEESMKETRELINKKISVMARLVK
jgi:uncharacterized membrane protein/glutaredoxin